MYLVQTELGMPARNLCLFVHLQIRTYKRGCVLLCRNASVRHRNNFLSTHSYYLQTFQIGISTDFTSTRITSRPYCFILANENGLWFNCAMYRSIISVFLCKPNLSLIFLRWLSTVWREIHSLSAISFSDEPLANNFTTLNSASLKYDVFTSLTGFFIYITFGVLLQR